MNVQDKDGRTPLVYACLHGDVESARLLLEAGADANLANPMHYAKLTKNRDMVALVHSFGASDKSSRASVRDKYASIPKS